MFSSLFGSSSSAPSDSKQSSEANEKSIPDLMPKNHGISDDNVTKKDNDPSADQLKSNDAVVVDDVGDGIDCDESPPPPPSPPSATKEDNINPLLEPGITSSLSPLLLQSYPHGSISFSSMYEMQEKGVEENNFISSSYLSPSLSKVQFWMKAHSLSCLRQGSCFVGVENILSDFPPPVDFSHRKEMAKEAIRSSLEGGCIWVNGDGTMERRQMDDVTDTGTNKDEQITKADCDVLVFRTNTAGKSHDGMITNLTGNLAKLSLNSLKSTSGIKTSDTSEEIEGIQMASAAQFIASKFNQKICNTNALDSASREAAGRVAAQAIQQAPTTGTVKPAGVTAVAPSPARGYGMAAASATYSVAKSAVGGIGSVFRSLLVSYDLADEYDVGDGDTNDDAENDTAYGAGEDDQYDDAMQSSLRKADKAMAQKSNLVIADDDLVWNIHVVVICCRLLLKHVENIAQEQSDGDYSENVNVGKYIAENDGQALILLDRWGDGFHSFGRLCHNAGASSALSTAPNFPSAYGRLLSNLGSRSIDLIALILLATGHGAMSDDGKVIAIQTGAQGHGIVSRPTLSDIDVALFQMDKTIIALERRMDKLSSFAENAKNSALAAKRNGQASLALLHMKRRKMSLEELERCSGTLLNLESAASSLRRAQSDAQVVKCYDTIRSAMSLIRKSEEKGGLGLTADRVSNTMDEIAEETEELGKISNSLDAMMKEQQGEDIDDEHLEEELQNLEAMIISEKKSASPAQVDIENNDPEKEEVQSSEQTQESRYETQEESNNNEAKKPVEAS